MRASAACDGPCLLSSSSSYVVQVCCRAWSMLHTQHIPQHVRYCASVCTVCDAYLDVLGSMVHVWANEAHASHSLLRVVVTATTTTDNNSRRLTPPYPALNFSPAHPLTRPGPFARLWPLRSDATARGERLLRKDFLLMGLLRKSTQIHSRPTPTLSSRNPSGTTGVLLVMASTNRLRPCGGLLLRADCGGSPAPPSLPIAGKQRTASLCPQQHT
jgi:hypothetical protein